MPRLSRKKTKVRKGGARGVLRRNTPVQDTFSGDEYTLQEALANPEIVVFLVKSPDSPQNRVTDNVYARTREDLETQYTFRGSMGTLTIGLETLGANQNIYNRFRGNRSIFVVRRNPYGQWEILGEIPRTIRLDYQLDPRNPDNGFLNEADPAEPPAAAVVERPAGYGVPPELRPRPAPAEPGPANVLPNFRPRIRPDGPRVDEAAALRLQIEEYETSIAEMERERDRWVNQYTDLMARFEELEANGLDEARERIRRLGVNLVDRDEEEL